MKAKKQFKRNKSILPLFISLIIILSFTIFASIYVITNNSSNEQNLNENSNPLKLGNLLQYQNVNPSLNLEDLIFYHIFDSTYESRGSGSSGSSDDVNEEINLGNPTEDSATDSDNEETDTTDNSDSIDNIQTSDNKKSNLIDDENDGFIDVIVMLKDDEMLGRAIDSPVEKKLSEIKSKVKTKQDEVLSTLDSSEFHLKHKYKTVSGFAGKISSEGLAKLEQDPNVEAIYEDEMLHITLMDSVPLINANDIHDLGITGEGTVVCVVDTGIDYTHPDLGNPSCNISQTINGNIESDIYESSHPYDDYEDYTWTITKPGYNNIAVHFERIGLEKGYGYYDYIEILDSDDNIVQFIKSNLPGAFSCEDMNDTWSISVPGDTIKIRLVSDFIYNCYGFKIDQVLNGTIDSTWNNCGRVIDGYDFVNNDNDPMDDNSHGTHVAGIVAANGELKGVAPDAELVAVKVLDNTGSGWFSDVAAGVDWCNSKSGTYNIVATTMSLSDGGEYNSTTCPNLIDNAINRAHDLDIAVTVASGNNGYSNGISYPACSPNAISVGSTTKWDDISSFTNTGVLLDLLAPGSWIYSTVLNGAYTFKSGTSMAAPHVAGAIALAKQFLPLASPDEIVDVLKDTGEPITDIDNNLSFSRIDLLAAARSIVECFSDSDCDDSNPDTEDICNAPGTTESSCTHLPISCLIDSDCGTDDWVGEPSCQNDSVLQTYRIFICNNPGEIFSFCSYNDTLELKENCGEDEYSNNYCYGNDLYRDFTDRGCSSGSCFETTTEQLVEECEYGCVEDEGRCKVEVCKTICNYGTCYEYCIWE